MSSKRPIRTPRGLIVGQVPAVLLLLGLARAAFAIEGEPPNPSVEDRVEVLRAEILKRERKTARTFISLGRAHLAAERYEDAATAFGRAVELDAESSEVRLLLGTALYRAGRFAEARDSFAIYLEADPENADARLLLALARIELDDLGAAQADLERLTSAESPHRATALIHLARVQQRRGDWSAARSTYREALEAAPDASMRQQIEGMIAVVDHREKAERSVRLRASVAGLYDDNVAVEDVDTTTGTTDGAAEFEAGGSYRFRWQETSHVDIGYDLFQSLYGDSSNFDLQTHSASVVGSSSVADFDLDARYGFTHVRLDDGPLFDLHQFAPSIAGFAGTQWYWRVSPRISLKNFEAGDRDAWQASFDAMLFRFFPDQRGHAMVTVGYDHEDADAGRFDYDAFRTRASFKLVTFAKVDFTAYYGFRLRDYTKVTPSIDEERRDEVHTVGTSFSRALGKGFELSLSYEHEIAKSNLPIVDYDQNHIRLKLGWTY